MRLPFNSAALFLLTILAPTEKGLPQSSVDSKSNTNIVEFHPRNAKAQLHPIILSFEGTVYASQQPLSTIKANRISSDGFIALVIETNRVGSESAIIDLWVPEEKNEIQKHVLNADEFQRNQKFFQQIDSSILRVKVLYGDYELMLVEHKTSSGLQLIKAYPTIKIQNKYFMTNTLSSDPIFQYFSNKYAEELLKHQ